MKKKVSTGVGMLIVSIALAISLNAIAKSMQTVASLDHQMLVNEAMSL